MEEPREEVREGLGVAFEDIVGGGFSMKVVSVVLEGIEISQWERQEQCSSTKIKLATHRKVVSSFVERY